MEKGGLPISSQLSSSALAAIEEIRHVDRECSDFFKELRKFYPVISGAPYPETYRLLVLPLLYSLWERCFTICHAIGLRLLRDSSANAYAMKATERAIWLIRAPFYQSLVGKLTVQPSSETNQKPKRGQFAALCDFLKELDSWHSSALDTSIDTGELVITFSNVNPKVVELNAKAIGIWDSHYFKAIKLGRLNDLVGRRNEIGHGAVIAPPPNAQFVELWEYAENLVKAYCNAFVCWITCDPRF